MPVFQPQYSYEATTLDYLSPAWYPFREDAPTGQEGAVIEFASKEEAEAFAAAKREANEAQGQKQGFWEPVVYKVATVPTKVEHDEFLEAEFAANRQYWAGRAEAARIQEANTPSKGKDVEVVRGRKVPIGTKGYVIWYGEGNWGPRVGIKDAAGEVHWTAASNVAVITTESKKEAA